MAAMKPAACVIGWPVKQSRAPIIHGYWNVQHRLDVDFRQDAVQPEDIVGIAVDACAVGWDPDQEAGIARAGRRICSYHVSNWLTDTQSRRLDRGMMGDGVIDLPAMRRMVEADGYEGHVEAEIFSERNWWQRGPDEVIGMIKQRIQEAT